MSQPPQPLTPVELFLLGRTLMKIGEEALPEPALGTGTGSRTGGGTFRGGTRAVLVVLSDVYAHDDTTVGAIASRTGLPQSQVSGAVARLKESGSIETAPDPADGRRQLIRQAAAVSERVAEVRGAGIEEALATALGASGTASGDTTEGRRDADADDRLREVTEALAVLARHLTPESVSRLRP
ncbi:MarR family transcriptional regulator [Streptomyces sp. NPDC059524]|uniref:MarR family transcriptional regulator n=1 Tax=Streptomyces sp. NPDC059524 TaxID=3346856 RepID=UPI003698AF8A